MTQFTASRTVCRFIAVTALAAVLVACGRGKDEDAAVKPAADNSTATAGGAAATPPVVENPEDKRLANAVVTGKTAAAVDLKYDVLAKPDVGQPFEIELVLLPRLAADALEVEVTGVPGLTIVSGGTLKFDAVTAGGRHAEKVLVRADAPGLYYVNVIARLVSKVQTDARTFSVPVVVGAVPAAEKPEPAKDASGEPVQSMPAAESTTPAEPAPAEPAKP
jgi:hypothetical protein